jgi:hypothetical protein
MVKKTRKRWIEIPEYVSIAAILVTIAVMFAAVCWITSGKAGGTASDRKTAALGFMMLRLEAATEASSYRTQAQMNYTLADICFARAEATDNENLKSYLDNLGYGYITMTNFYLVQAENAENRAQTYLNGYNEALAAASAISKVADYRSTGALIFNVSAAIASCAVLVKRRELLYVYLPIFAIGAYHLIMSLL